MQRYKNIVFDLGNVLIPWQPRWLFNKVFANDSKKVEWFLQHVCTPTWNDQLDCGKPFKEAVEELTLLFPDYAPQINIYNDRWIEMIGTPIVETLAILEELKGRKYKILGLSNWSDEKYQLARDKFEFFKHFEGLIISGQEKVIKPDPKIYEILLSRYQIDAKETIFIDDIAKNIAGAEKFGITGIQFISAKQLREDLQKLAVL